MTQTPIDECYEILAVTNLFSSKLSSVENVSLYIGIHFGKFLEIIIIIMQQTSSQYLEDTKLLMNPMKNNIPQ